MYYKSKGIIRYEGDTNDHFKVIVEVDPEITRLARFLIPKYLPWNYPKYAPHISVVRKEIPPLRQNWGLYSDQWVDFEYDPEVSSDETYYWLRVFAPALSDLRVGLGLPPSRSPKKDALFHITVANRKAGK